MNREPVLATVVAWHTTKGVRLHFDGESEASSKFYKCRNLLRVDVGDRVLAVPCSGTYVVAMIVGYPSRTLGNMNQCPTGDSATAANCAAWINAMITALSNQGVISKNGW